MEGIVVDGTNNPPSKQPAASSSVLPKKSRHHLSLEGNAILEEYWRTHASYDMPNLQTRRRLVDQIQKLPGCEFYQNVNISSYFKRQIQKLRQSVPLPESDSRFPSLSPTALKNLAVLVKERPDPSEIVLKVWASLLAPMGATEQDIFAWSAHTKALLQMQAQSLSKPEPASASMRMPTPSDTVTPEPLTAASSMSPQTPIQELVPIPGHSKIFKHCKPDPEAQSPVIPAQRPFIAPAPTAMSYNREESPLQVATTAPAAPVPNGPTPHSRVTSRVTTEACTPMSYAPMAPARGDPQRGDVEPPQCARLPAMQAIVAGVTDALSSPRTPQDDMINSPTSATEFEAMFAAYRQRLAPLIHELDP